MEYIEAPKFMEVFFIWLFVCFFRCHHRNISRVFTIQSRTYRVCYDCGTKYDYILGSDVSGLPEILRQ